MPAIIDRERIVEAAKAAGFGCDCTEECAHAIGMGVDEAVLGFGWNVVLLPKAAGIEALERFEKVMLPFLSPGNDRPNYWAFRCADKLLETEV